MAADPGIFFFFYLIVICRLIINSQATYWLLGVLGASPAYVSHRMRGVTGVGQVEHKEHKMNFNFIVVSDLTL